MVLFAAVLVIVSIASALLYGVELVGSKFMPLQYIVITLVGFFAAVQSNTGIAVFNDGLRPIVPAYLEGELKYSEYLAISFALSFGLIIGFGIPFSIGKSVILIHTILLGTDIIGTWVRRGRWGFLLSGILGALYGLAIMLGLDAIVKIVARLPIDFMPALQQMGSPIVLILSAFPALVVGTRYGFKHGIITFVITVLFRQATDRFGTFQWGSTSVALKADGVALLVGLMVMLIYAAREKNTDGSNANTALLGLFAERVGKIKKNIWQLMISGGLTAMAASLYVLAEGPASLGVIADALPFMHSDPGAFANNMQAAIIISLARSISFIPLVMTTAIATGVYSPEGVKLGFVLGLLAAQLSFGFLNPILAFVLGAICIALEVYLLGSVAGLMDKLPGMRACADEIRHSTNKVLEIGLFSGSLLAAYKLAPSFGFLFIGGVYALNATMKKPIVSMAVGPIAVIMLGASVNVLYLLGLFALPK